jgi:AcrR family transcriptional regulator
MDTSSQHPHEPWRAFEARQRNPELKREMLLKTAAHLFLERGFRQTSMNDLAKLLGISKPALYYYFPNKDEILVSCYEQGIAVIESTLDRSGKQKGTGLERIRALIAAYVETVVTVDFGLCVGSLDDEDLNPESREKVRKLKRRIDSTAREFLEEGMRDGSVRNCDSKLVAFAMAGAINWIGIWYDRAGPLKAADIVESFTDYLVGGVSPQKKTVRSNRGKLPAPRRAKGRTKKLPKGK